MAHRELRRVSQRVQYATEFKGAVMPRKAKAFKSRLRAAAKAASQGKSEEANKMWQQITVELPANGDHFVYLEVAEPSPDRMAWSAPIWITKI